MKVTQQKLKEYMPARKQIPLMPMSISIRDLVANRKRYFSLIRIQRGKSVWPLWEKQLWIDTLLRGNPVPPLMYAEDLTGNLQQEDGQQRVCAILEFIDDGFPLMTEDDDSYKYHSGGVLIAQGRFFRELLPNEQNILLDFQLPTLLHEQLSEEEEAEAFRRLQLGESLSAAEIHATFNSKGMASCRMFTEHTYWKDFFMRENIRGIINEYSAWFALIESSPTGIRSLARDARDALAKGIMDERLGDNFVQSVIHVMDTMCIIFQGVTFASPKVAIIMYQTAHFLCKLDIPIHTQEHSGILAEWLKGIMKQSRSRMITRIEQKNAQTLFWQEEWKNVLRRLQSYSFPMTVPCPGLE